MARELRVRVAADTSQFESSMRSMQERMDRVGRSMTDVGRRMTTTVTAGIVAVGTAAIVATNRLGNMADELLDLEQQTGLTTDQLQEFQNVARVAGVSSDALARAARGLQTQMRATGDESAQFRNALNMLGISARDEATGGLRRMSELMPEILTGLRGMENQTDRNSLAMQLFGSRMAHDLIPVLGMTEEQFQAATAEAHEMGQVLGRDTLEAANEARIAWEQFQARLGLAGREITVALLPAVTDLTETLTDRLVPIVQAVAERVAGAVEWFTNLNDSTQNTILVVTGLTAAAGPALVVLGTMVRLAANLRAGFMALRTAMLFFTGPVGLFALAAGGAVALVAAFDGARRSAISLNNTLVGYINTLDITSEAEREAALETVRAERAKLEAVRQSVHERIAMVHAIQQLAGDVSAGPGSIIASIIGVAAERFSVEPALDALRDAEANLEELERAIREFEIPVRDSTPALLEDLGDTGVAAFDDITAAVERTTGAVREAAEAARLWADRLAAEVRLGVKDADEVLALLAPRVVELREEARQALKDFGFDSEEFRDVMAKLDELESALDRIVGPERKITPEVEVGTVDDADDEGEDPEAIRRHAAIDREREQRRSMRLQPGEFQMTPDGFAAVSTVEMARERERAELEAQERIAEGERELAIWREQRHNDWMRTIRGTFDEVAKFREEREEQVRQRNERREERHLQTLVEHHNEYTESRLALSEMAERRERQLAEATLRLTTMRRSDALEQLEQRFGTTTQQMLFTLQAVEQAEGGFESLDDAILKLSRSSVPITLEIYEHLEERFKETNDLISEQERRLRSLATVLGVEAPSALERLAEQLGVTTDRLREMIEQGIVVGFDLANSVVEAFDFMETAVQQAVSRMATHLQRLGGFLGELAIGAHDTASDVVRAFGQMVVNTIREILSFIVAQQAAIIAVQGFHAATLNPVGFAAAAAGLVAASAAAAMLGGRRATSPVREPPAEQEPPPDPVGGAFGVETDIARPDIGLTVGRPTAGLAVGTPVLDGGRLILDAAHLQSETMNIFNEATIRFVNAVSDFADLMTGDRFATARAL